MTFSSTFDDTNANISTIESLWRSGKQSFSGYITLGIMLNEEDERQYKKKRISYNEIK